MVVAAGGATQELSPSDRGLMRAPMGGRSPTLWDSGFGKPLQNLKLKLLKQKLKLKLDRVKLQLLYVLNVGVLLVKVLIIMVVLQVGLQPLDCPSATHESTIMANESYQVLCVLADLRTNVL